jgi:hypothetical protein
MRKLLTFFLIALAAAVGVSASSFGGSMSLLGVGTPPASGGGVTWAYKTQAVGGGVGPSSSITFSSVAIGSTVSSDIVVLIFAGDNGGGSGVPNSVTVAGNSATLVATDTSGVDYMTMWSLSGVTLGSTSTVIASTDASTTIFNVGFNVGVISGSAHPTGTGSAVAASTATPFTVTKTVPSGGIAIVGMGIAVSVTGVWTNATGDNDLTRGSDFDLMAHTALGTGASITPNMPTGGNLNHGLIGVWGP